MKAEKVNADRSNRLLIPNEASHILSDAEAMTSSFTRFGQVLWNTLESAYPALSVKFHGTEADFYYVIPKQEVIDIFISNFVEQE